ncbi:MAG: ABC transporter ATP-binding protein [Anaerolineae bacterium]
MLAVSEGGTSQVGQGPPFDKLRRRPFGRLRAGSEFIEGTPLVEVRNLSKVFPVTKGFLFTRLVAELKAVDKISFSIFPGETLGLVGESGCGKSTTGKLILRLLEPTGGTVYFQGQDIFALEKTEMLRLRRQMQMVFQDPYSSLNPRKTVAEIIAYPMRVTDAYRGRALQERVQELLYRVGLNPHHANRYPHQFSGGQRQRIGVARALAVDPQFVVLDEPVSALDVSIQAQIINLLMDLQEELNLAYLFIAHDLNVVEHLSDRVAVMYLGKIVELADCDKLFSNPKHPYTRALLSAVLATERDQEEIVLEGEIPSPTAIPSGCRFRTRCYMAEEMCAQVEPPWEQKGDGHWVACHFAD